MSDATTSAVRSLFAVVEQYPDIKSQGNVLDLQNEIERIEGQIADRRELYNDQVFQLQHADRAGPGAAPRPDLRLAAARVLHRDTRGDGPARHGAPAGVSDTDQSAGPEPVERQLWLARHGETEWSRSGQHTGRTNMPLTETGRTQAVALGERLRGHSFALVLTSPLARAADTARLAGFGDVMVVDEDLREWDYGDFEGRKTDEIREQYPDWTIWRGPWPGGESIDEVAARADRILQRVGSVDGDVLIFSHGHLLRVLAARWLGLRAPGRRDVRPVDGDDLAARLGTRGTCDRTLERGRDRGNALRLLLADARHPHHEAHPRLRPLVHRRRRAPDRPEHLVRA